MTAGAGAGEQPFAKAVRAAAVALFGAAPAGPAAAQDAQAALASLRGCLVASERPEDCRSAYSRQCAAEVPGGQSIAGMSACAAAEAEGWDALLNETYAELVVLSKQRAAAEGEAIGQAPLETMLREAQRAWIAFRDTDCAHEYALWGEGSQRQVAGTVCLLERTADRVLELRGKLGQMQVD